MIPAWVWAAEFKHWNPLKNACYGGPTGTCSSWKRDSWFTGAHWPDGLAYLMSSWPRRDLISKEVKVFLRMLCEFILLSTYVHMFIYIPQNIHSHNTHICIHTNTNNIHKCKYTHAHTFRKDKLRDFYLDTICLDFVCSKTGSQALHTALKIIL